MKREMERGRERERDGEGMERGMERGRDKGSGMKSCDKLISYICIYVLQGPHSAHSVCMHVFSIYVGTYLKYIHYAHYASKYTYMYVSRYVRMQICN